MGDDKHFSKGDRPRVSNTHWVWGIAISVGLHAMALLLWQPTDLHADKMHVAGDISLIAIAPKPVAAPLVQAPPKKEPLPPKPRPIKRRRMVKKPPPPAPVVMENPAIDPPDDPPGVPSEAQPEQPVEATTCQAPAPTVGPSPEDRLRCYANQVRQCIEAKKSYPRRARQNQMEGAVRVRFVLTASGEVKAITIIKGSRFGVLNTAAKKAVLAAAPFPALPNALAREPMSLEVTLNFELT